MEPAEREVWERVQAQPVQYAEEADLRQLADHVRQTAAVYRMIARESGGRRRELAMGLWDREKANLACLRGLYRLCTGGTMGLPGREMPSSGWGMEACYNQSLWLLQEYTARSAQPRYGAVYQQMARRQEISCGALAELLDC